MGYETNAQRLKALCHSKKCKKTYECPRKHKSCRTRLDTNTAIAWVLSEMLMGKKGIYKRAWTHKQLSSAAHLAFQAVSQHRSKRGISSELDFIDFHLKSTVRP